MTTAAENSSLAIASTYLLCGMDRGPRVARGFGGVLASGHRSRAPRELLPGHPEADARTREHSWFVVVSRSAGVDPLRTRENDAVKCRAADRKRHAGRGPRWPLPHRSRQGPADGFGRGIPAAAATASLCPDAAAVSSHRHAPAPAPRARAAA